METYYTFVDNVFFIPCGVVFLFYLCYNIKKYKNESENSYGFNYLPRMWKRSK